MHGDDVIAKEAHESGGVTVNLSAGGLSLQLLMVGWVGSGVDDSC